jgi:hypothetical protein
MDGSMPPPHMHTYFFLCVYVCMCVCVYVCVPCVCMCVCVYVCLGGKGQKGKQGVNGSLDCVLVCMCVCVWVCMGVCVCVCVCYLGTFLEQPRVGTWTCPPFLQTCYIVLVGAVVEDPQVQQPGSDPMAHLSGTY